jgi:hypothetical protein
MKEAFMRSIIIKDLWQERWSILIACAVSLALFALHIGDRDVIFAINFGIIGPMFMWITTQKALAGEQTAGTLPFLLSLPLDRKKIWLSKALSSLIIGLIGYMALYILAVSTGMDPLPKGFRFFDFKIYPFELFLLGPLMAWSVGIFTTVIHPTLSAIVIIIVSMAVGIQGFRHEIISNINWTIYFVIAIVIFAISSYLHFLRQPHQNCNKFKWFSLKFVLFAIIIFIFILSGLNLTAEYANRNFYKPDISGIAEISSNKKYLLYSRNEPFLFETIENRDILNFRLFDQSTGNQYSIGQRIFKELSHDQNLNKFMYTTDLGLIAPGKTKLYYQNPETGHEIFIDYFASPLGFDRHGNALFTRLVPKNDPEAEKHSFILDSSQLVCSALKSFNPANHSTTLIATFPADTEYFEYVNDSFNCALVRSKKNIWFIDLSNRSIKKLSINLDPNKEYFFGALREKAAFIIRYGLRSSYDKKTYLVFAPDGSYKTINTNNEVRLIDAHENGTWVYYKYSDANCDNYRICVGKADGSTQILDTENETVSDAKISQSGKYLALRSWKNEVNYPQTIWIFDLTNPEQSWKIRNCEAERLWAGKDDSFLYVASDQMLCLNENSFDKPQMLFDLRSLFGKGGSK